MSIEWHYLITEEGQVMELGTSEPSANDLQQLVSAAFAACISAFQALGEAAMGLWDAIVAAWEPVVEALNRFWRDLPPYIRSWLRRRVRYGGRPVTGPPQRARFAYVARRA